MQVVFWTGWTVFTIRNAVPRQANRVREFDLMLRNDSRSQ